MSSVSPQLIGIVVGEESGDILGAGLMAALKRHYPNAHFVGIGGPRMLAAGFESLFAQDRLAVMGFVEPLKRLPELLSIRRQLIHCFIDRKPLVVIGIDSPDFNLGLELAVKKAGIKTAHYVSPSVWAWRQGRIKKIAKAVNLMLTLLPFEAAFYQQYKVPVRFVGHPLADDIPMVTSSEEALLQLQQSPKSRDEIIVALLPGSRSGEVQRMADVFISVAELLQQQNKKIRFLIPSANPKRHSQLEEMIKARPAHIPLTLIAGQSQKVMAAADVVLMASGTTSLEALLLKKPMVIAYKVAPFSYWIFKRMVRVAHIGLPNLLAGREVVPELIQHEATAEKLAAALMDKIRHLDRVKAELIPLFDSIHQQLRQNASATAASAIADLIESRHEEK